MGETVVFDYFSSNILVVEDEIEISDLIVDLLSETGANILTAYDGVEALKVIENNAIDLILTDVHMPEMDGLELLSEVNKHHPDILSIIITSVGDKETVLKALQLNAFDFFEKPLSPNILIAKVGNTLEICKNRRLLKLALREWMLQKFSKLELSDFESKTMNEQNDILKATLEIFKLKSLSNMKKGVQSA